MENPDSAPASAEAAAQMSAYDTRLTTAEKRDILSRFGIMVIDNPNPNRSAEPKKIELIGAGDFKLQDQNNKDAWISRMNYAIFRHWAAQLLKVKQLDRGQWLSHPDASRLCQDLRQAEGEERAGELIEFFLAEEGAALGVPTELQEIMRERILQTAEQTKASEAIRRDQELAKQRKAEKAARRGRK